MTNPGYQSNGAAPGQEQAQSAGGGVQTEGGARGPFLTSNLRRASLWIAIVALIAAAIICVAWVMLDTQGGVIGRAFLTVLLFAVFALIALGEANMSDSRPSWLVVASMISWVVVLIAGALLIWMPAPEFFEINGTQRFFHFLLITLIIQATVLYARLYVPVHRRYPIAFNVAATYVTTVMAVALAAMLVVPLVTFEWFEFMDLYWRIVVSLAILVALGTAIVPLVNALFAPKVKRPRPQPQGWPTYPDGRTPLPVARDGQPDWYAYYSGNVPPQAAFPVPGYPPAGYPQQAQAPAYPQAAPQQQFTNGYATPGYAPAPGVPAQAAPQAPVDDDTAQGQR